MAKVPHVAATTKQLEDGWQFTKGQLEELAGSMIGRPTHLDHRSDLPAVGYTTRAWVAPTEDEVNHALWVEDDFGPDTTVDDVQRILAGRQGASAAFFGQGVVNHVDGPLEIQVGVSPELGIDMLALLAAIEEREPDRDMAVCEYHEHAAVHLTCVISDQEKLTWKSPVQPGSFREV